MTWDTFSGPGEYRACVPRPEEGELQHDMEHDDGDRTEHRNMTVLQCLQHCNRLVRLVAHI